VKYILIC